jgi:hypothetical protein
MINKVQNSDKLRYCVKNRIKQKLISTFWLQNSKHQILVIFQCFFKSLFPLRHLYQRAQTRDTRGAAFGPPGVNFINLKRVNFTHEHLFSSYFLALNELLYKKRAQKTLMKLSPGVFMWPA